jgi:hypothetical protein
MAAKRRSGRTSKKEVKYFKEDSSDEEEEVNLKNRFGSSNESGKFDF